MVMEDVIDLDQVMEGMEIMATTESAQNGSIDPSALYQDPMDRNATESPEPERPTKRHDHRPESRGSISKVPNGSRTDRSPSFKVDMATVVPASKLKGPKSANLPYVTNVTGLVYDVRMRFHVEVASNEDIGIHPEDPRRIHSIYQELVNCGLVDSPDSLEPLTNVVLGRIEVKEATKEQICAVHTERHYDWVNSLKDWDNGKLLLQAKRMDSVFLSKNTGLCSRLSAGGAIAACRAIWKGEVKNAVAIIRPPGHHAEHDAARGFCFFNNVPIAAKAMQKEFPECRKVLIVDWDVHHGNGIQEVFYDDPNVLYISLHVYSGGKFYPTGDYGDHLHCGEGAGVGRNVNIPWETAGMTDGDYLYAFQQVIMPIAQDFNPDMVIVSAGFDAAEGDMLGRCHVSPAGYAHMTHALMSLANGKIAICLEGGYNLRSIAISAAAVTRTLMGEPPHRLHSVHPLPGGVKTVQLVRRTQAKFWPCLFPRNQSEELRDFGADRMHDVIRAHQRDTLFHKFKMSSLFIARTKLSKSFEHQVLATPNYTEDRPLLLIFHDPPSLKGDPNPVTNELEPHNTYLTDSVKLYIEWAVANGFAVIDINIPKYLTGSEDNREPQTNESEAAKAAREQEALDLARYVWENYVEVYDHPHIFFMGVGAAYSTILQLLKTHDPIREQIGTNGRIFGFISPLVNFAAYKSPTEDPYAERWYRDSSLIYVAAGHPIWQRYEVKAPSRRWGTLRQTSDNDLQEMLQYNKDEVTQIMATVTEPWTLGKKQSSVSSPDELSAMNIDAAPV